MSVVGLASSIRTREAWNWVFRRQRRGAYVRIHLLEGPPILGKFDTQSFASSDAELRDLYIEELWSADTDGWFEEALPNSSDIWISGGQIASIEFFEGQDEEVTSG